MAGYIQIDKQSLASFPMIPFAIRHKLSENPLLSLEKLVELAATLPRDQIEYNSGKVSISQNPSETPMVDLDPVAVVASIREANAWMVLKRVEAVPAYKALLHEVMNGLGRDLGHADADDAGFTDIEGFIFVSSPNATTPFHSDPEDNFFVQIHGDKFFHIIDNQDGKVVPDEALEVSHATHRNLPYTPEFEERAHVFTMNAGDGCFVPYLWPHWVKTGDSHSISMAITWKSRAVKRANKVLFVNSFLRKLGLPQPMPGKVPALDWAKAAAYTAARAPLQPLKNNSLARAVRAALFGRDEDYLLKNNPKA
jgi:hypothetical protein